MTALLAQLGEYGISPDRVVEIAAHPTARHVPYLDLYRQRARGAFAPDAVIEGETGPIAYIVEAHTPLAPREIASMRRVLAFRDAARHVAVIEPGRLTLYGVALDRRTPADALVETVERRAPNARTTLQRLRVEPTGIIRGKQIQDLIFRLMVRATQTLESEGLSMLIEQTRSGDYDDIGELLDAAQAQVHQLGQHRGAGFAELRVVLRHAVERIQAAYEAKSVVTGVASGFLDLDRLTAGWQPGDLIVLAARPAMGKTALAMNFATNAVEAADCTVAVFSLEMPSTQLATRMLASVARVDGERLRTGHLSDGDVDRILEAVRRMNDWPIHLDDTAGLSVMEVRARCRRLAAAAAASRPLGLVIIDYLQLMKGRAGKRNREQEISDISRNLKALAKELDVPVIALSQLNRGVESRPNKRPLMSDLRESGAIEQDADVIGFVYRDDYYNPDSEDVGMAEVILAKQRNGPTGTCKLRFFKEWSRFGNVVLDS